MQFICEVCITSYIPYVCKRCPTICSKCKILTFHSHHHLCLCQHTAHSTKISACLSLNWRLQVEWKTHCPKVLIFTTLKWLVHGNHLIFQWLLKLWAIDEIGLGGYFGSCMVSQLFISISFKIFGYKLAYETAWHAETAYLYCSLWVIDLLITKKA